MSGQVVAKLVYPMPAGAMGELVRAVEAIYGPGLLVDYAHPEAREWMVLVRPEADA